ncbi:MAG TPA: hypothetical protein VJ464_13740 [Blastocatellia bacterium]|nr:hypothetical protein [Blastocatellia bacterium]
MPKSRTRKHRSKYKSKRTRRRSVSLFKSTFKKIRSKLTVGKIIASAVALISIISAYITIFGYWTPRIEVQPLSGLNPKNALTARFSITNQGSMSIYNVALGHRFINYKVMDYAEGIVISKRDGTESKEPEIGEIGDMVAVPDYYKEIAPMKSATVDLGYSVPPSMEPVQDLDIEVVVYFRPAWYPFERRESFRFVTQVAADGQIQWLPRPDSKPYW